MSFKRIYLIFFILLFSIISNLNSRTTFPKEAVALEVVTNSIVIDGKLNEEVWRKLIPVTNFLQKDPNEGSLASGSIEVRFAFDESYLYIAAKMSHNEEIRATTSRRDEAGNSERIIFSFDTYKDNRTAYSFGITATGVRIDYSHQNDAEYNRDYSFDPVWSAKTTIEDSSWFAEIKIPFSQLRFNELTEQVWGLNMNWWLPSLREDNYWVVVPKNESGWSSRMGILKGIKNIKPTSRIEIMPYMAGNIIHNPDISDDNPFHNKLDYNYRAGLDFKMGLGPDFSLDATINPDFGQVEADPAEVNLTAYETFFSENRPFFIEGRQLLQGYSNSFFYSRRIGQKPKIGLDANYVDNPLNTQILGAAKISGRTKEGISLGILSALTNEETGKSLDSLGAEKLELPVAPLTSYNVFRIKKELPGENISSFGLLLTNVYRNLENNDILLSNYVNNAFTGDADWFYRFDSSKYQFDGHLGFSYVTGDERVIYSIQKSTAHLFQRPDAKHLTLDSSKTILSGFTGAMKFAKIAGENWLWEVNGGFISPELELNDIGQFHKADQIYHYGLLRYRENKPGQLFHSYSIYTDFYNEYDFGFNNLFRKITLKPNMTFIDRSTLNLGSWYEFSTPSRDKTRGGPMMLSLATFGAMLEYASDWTANNQFSFYAEANSIELEGWNMQFVAGISLKFWDRFQFALKPRFMKGVNPQQYVATFTNSDNIETYNKRYIFARLDLQNISLQMRMNYAFTPDMTLEYYLEPFATSGIYSNFGELKKPQTHDLLIYGTENTIIQKSSGIYTIIDDKYRIVFKNPDFNYLSFRSNLVLRWEFLPGSTFYLVWQQNKENYGNMYDRVQPKSLWESFDRTGINSFAVKFSYWFPVN